MAVPSAWQRSGNVVGTNGSAACSFLPSPTSGSIHDWSYGEDRNVSNLDPILANSTWVKHLEKTVQKVL